MYRSPAINAWLLIVKVFSTTSDYVHKQIVRAKDVLVSNTRESIQLATGTKEAYHVKFGDYIMGFEFSKQLCETRRA
jgi:hypothetical protein